MKGRSPTMRHVSRTHRVALDWLFDRINLDTKIQIKYIDTKNQLADTLTKGNFTRDEWNHLLCLFNISHFSSTACTCLQRGAQQFVIGDDETELDLSLGSSSFLERVNDQVRKRQKRSSMNVTEDGEKHSVIWGMFMSSTLESALFMGKNYSDNLHSIKNTKDLRANNGLPRSIMFHSFFMNRTCFDLLGTGRFCCSSLRERVAPFYHDLGVDFVLLIGNFWIVEQLLHLVVEQLLNPILSSSHVSRKSLDEDELTHFLSRI